MHSRLLWESSSLSGDGNRPPKSSQQQSQSSAEDIKQQQIWGNVYIRRSCSAAAKWKRKFSVAGGKWRCFKPSNVILESSQPSARATRLARISLVLTEISCQWGKKDCEIFERFFSLQYNNTVSKAFDLTYHLGVFRFAWKEKVLPQPTVQPQCRYIMRLSLTLMTWLSDLSGSSADWTMRWPMSLCNLPMAMASVVANTPSVGR